MWGRGKVVCGLRAYRAVGHSGLPGLVVVAMLRKAAFSLSKEALVAKK